MSAVPFPPHPSHPSNPQSAPSTAYSQGAKLRERGGEGGYRVIAGSGTAGVPVRSDIVEVYVFQRVEPGRKPPEPVFESALRTRVRRGHSMGDTEPGFPKESIYFLQLLRSRQPLAATWHPVMGHMDLDAGGHPETARMCAERELREEIGLSVQDASVRGFWALEQVHPFFVEAINSIVLSPRFAVEVVGNGQAERAGEAKGGGGGGRGNWQPRLNDEHSQWRWVAAGDLREAFLWPGQRRAAEEVLESVARSDAPEREHLRVR